MAKVLWSAEAKESFEAALAYIAETSPDNATLVRGRILNTLSNLEVFSLGLPGPRNHLKLYIPKTSYFVIFSRNQKDEIIIRTFVHTSRDWGRIDWDKLC